MRVLISGLAVLLALLPAAVRADEPRADELVKALQRKVKKVREAAGPSVVCIYVSRSEAYRKAPYWGSNTAPEELGQLGRFDAKAALARVPRDAPHRARILRAIEEHDLSAPRVVPESYGSGIVVDAKGLVLTCAHVVKNATRVYVRVPGGRGSWADVHAADRRSDLAVLRLLDPPGKLTALELARGAGPKRGEFVVSLSNAFAPGFRPADEASEGYGIVSNLRQATPGNLEVGMDRSQLTLHHYGTLIQTDARTTPGCSGGALLNLDGKVIGLTTALAGVRGDQPGGFAIPLDASTARIVDVLKRGEEVEYGFLGVVVSEDRGRGPVYIQQVSMGSPAWRAGLRPGDQIVRINDQEVHDNNDLFLFIGMTLAGNPARLQVRRGRFAQPITVKATLAKFAVPGPVIASRQPPARFGLRVDHTSILAQRPFASRRGFPRGVIVREVVPSSPADRARLQPDKIITEVNGTSVTSPAEYYREIARTGNKVTLTYLTSDGRPEQVTLTQPR